MKNYYKTLFFVFTSLSFQLLAQPLIEWERSIGGSDSDNSSDIIQTADEGYIVIGSTDSNDGDVGENNGETDAWIVKIDNDGEIIWEQNFGGPSLDYFSSVKELDNGDLIIAGTSYIDGISDFSLTKLDQYGNMLWGRYYGGSQNEIAVCVEKTIDGGFIIGGVAESIDGDVGSNNGEYDIWIVKVNDLGDIIWERNYGGVLFESLGSIHILNDGGFIIAGITSDEIYPASTPETDSWVKRLDANGELLWEKEFEGIDSDLLYSIQSTIDGGFIACGASKSNDGDIDGNNGNFDFWVIKLDDIGNIIWSQNIGGSDIDIANSVLQTEEEEFIIAGFSKSNNGDVNGNYGFHDYWLIKLDINGYLIWEQNFGGTAIEFGRSLKHTTDNGLIFTGSSRSGNGDVSTNNGNYDFWIIKLSPLLTGITSNLNEFHFDLFPNPSNGSFTISFTKDEAEFELSIFDIMGNRVYFAKNSMNKFEIKNMQKGVYILHLFKHGQLSTRKLVIN